MDEMINSLDMEMWSILCPIMLMEPDMYYFTQEINRLRSEDLPEIGFNYRRLYRSVLEYQIKAIHVNKPLNMNKYIGLVQGLLSKLPK